MSITLLQFAKEIGIASKDATSITNLTPEKLGELLQTISSIKSQRDEETKHNSDLASVKTLETKIAEASNNKNLDELNILEGQKGEHENTLEELKKELKSKQQLLKKSQATLNLIEKYTQIKTPLFEPILLDLMNEVGAEKFMEGIKSITSEKNSEKNEWKIRGILHDSKTMLSIYKKLNQDDKKTFAKLYFNSYARHEILIDPVQPPGSTDQKSTTVLFGSLLDAALYFGEDFKTLSDLIASSNWETQSRITTISDNFTVSDNFTDREEKLYSFNLIASSTSLKPAQKRALLNDMLKKSDQRHKSLLKRKEELNEKEKLNVKEKRQLQNLEKHIPKYEQSLLQNLEGAQKTIKKALAQTGDKKLSSDDQSIYTDMQEMQEMLRNKILTLKKSQESRKATQAKKTSPVGTLNPRSMMRNLFKSRKPERKSGKKEERTNLGKNDMVVEPEPPAETEEVTIVTAQVVEEVPETGRTPPSTAVVVPELASELVPLAEVVRTPNIDDLSKQILAIINNTTTSPEAQRNAINVIAPLLGENTDLNDEEAIKIALKQKPIEELEEISNILSILNPDLCIPLEEAPEVVPTTTTRSLEGPSRA